MLKDMTRSKLIQIWFAAVAIVAAGSVALGISMTLSTAVLLLGLSLVPPAILLRLWPGVQPTTAGEVLRNDRRA
jgi:hypothetical protein